ncbi:MAG: heme-binding domain-containing protein [Bacteroidota bacterium]
MKKILITLVFVLGIVQLIRPSKNRGEVDSAKSIEAKYPMPADVRASLQKACYDCHSNNTKYPWYADIQPVGWYLANHVRDGKRHLNFDEFMTYKAKQQDHKMKELIESQEEGWMPMDSYTLIHKEAILTQSEKDAIIAYAKSVKTSVGYKEESREEEMREHEGHDKEN